jgi:hypothetical protein
VSNDLIRPNDAQPSPDPFDPAALRLSGDHTATPGLKKMLLSVPVRTPAKDWFVRVHADENYSLETTVIELKEEREVYLVAPALREHLATEPLLSTRMLYTAITRQQVVFLWPCRLPRADGRFDDWGRTSLAAAGRARSRWVRMTANTSIQAYDVVEASGDLPEPVWPAESMRDLLKTAFGERHIDKLDHPVLRRLRGQA